MDWCALNIDDHLSKYPIIPKSKKAFLCSSISTANFFRANKP